jgi:hypothetical protein
MKTATVTLVGTAPLVQSRFHNTPKLPKEGADDYERRTWREKAHIGDDDTARVSPLALKNCVAEAAKYLSIQIPGKGKSTYSKHFLAGVIVTDWPPLGVKKEDMDCQWRHVDSGGQKGGNKRVLRCYPIFHKWRITVPFIVLDDVITEEVFEQHLAEAGRFIGIGSFRPRNGGIDGRFKVEKVVWS